MTKLTEDYGDANKCDKTKPVGRPAMAADDKRKPRSIKMTDQEWAEIQQRADQAGIKVSEYLRQKALKAGD